MFGSVDRHKNSFLENTKTAREERAQERIRELSAVKIQCYTRSFLCRRKLQKNARDDLDRLIQLPDQNGEGEGVDYKPKLAPALEFFKTVRRFLFFYNQADDKYRFEYLCRYLLISVQSDVTKNSYISVAMTKNALLWIQQVKDIAWKCCQCLKILRPENHHDSNSIMLHLGILVTFTSTTSWKILKTKATEALSQGMIKLCNNIMGHLNTMGLYPILATLLMKGLARFKPSFNKNTLSAIMTVALRPLIAANFSDNLLSVFLLHILSVPAIVHHISVLSPDTLAILITHRVFKRCLDLMTNEQSTRIIFNSLQGNYALCLMANLIQLGFSELEGLIENTLNFMCVMIRLLDGCQKYVLSKKSNLTHWHPVLGWFSQATDKSLHEAMHFVVKQLQLLWSDKMIRILFTDLIEYVEISELKSAPKASPSRNIIKKVIEKASQKNDAPKIKLESSMSTTTCLACNLYRTTLQTLSQLKMDVIGGLSYNEVLLPNLWRFLCDLGPNCGLKIYLDFLTETPNSTIHPVFSLLTLFCETASHLLTTLDDIEMYETQRFLKVSDYVKMSEFLNIFVFRVLWTGMIDLQTAASSDVYNSCWTLLMILHERDARRQFAPKNHWLIRDVKPSLFMAELDRGRKSVQFLMQKVPHIIPFNDRVILFRKYISKEKDVLGITESVCASPQSTLITVHRSRIVEDGYRQLAQLPSRALKGIIRVKFINEQGLDEAGIDQDGVFKEFLEETISRVFDPSLSLFKVTSEQKLYPSSTSFIQENHLALFEFVGKMLGKAVYEGIIIEIPFASFFLTQMLGHQQSSTYSSLDELPSLDPELAKSLNYIKHYDGDMCDLELTFSCDEDCMGRIETHELVPGGKAISVTNENKIRYVHLMAHFRMYRQIRDQTNAFIRGFKTVINKDWLHIFSAPEFQKLISGDNTDMDIEDLRRHTQYYGGYHNNHRVINWLWDILDKDFKDAEKSLFLKFVTSCSKPPLLGFAHLEPPFSIRCVEVSDDQDMGDTVGSVLKGFFNIKKKDAGGRLPTSSTCFNLLKLPNYSKKSILKEKLRYAIHSHSGFEIS
ncbi:hypothetical protein LOTGIDRAFT_201597 [Lottia gigantea]|uniref:Ubiquitin-protein ligase E3B n=1 Tax=Lottia gigantea TaxID=225164 RepID=V4C9W7_LOTGI|nr:hypothetical protein LOTGIDRAFT_201597 [Lottia gigantea]ESO98574.1 hypothetical protein LOTGIDRAFT_201597 [Lottia gigantea]